MLKGFYGTCDELARGDADLGFVLKTYGYPPLWSRPNSFESLVHIILEQQVSLASAKAALLKLKEKIGEIRPDSVLLLSDDAFRSCYFSRQKTAYTWHLAEAIQTGALNLKKLETESDDTVRGILRRQKGIGNWTVDIYLIFVLQRPDIFPAGDLAAVNALKKLKKLPALTTRSELLALTEPWRPYRSAATMMLWHYYLSGRAVPPKP